MVIFGLQVQVNPLCKNGHFSTFFTFCFYSLGRRFFHLEYRKRHFPGLYCSKRNFGKMVIFGPKPLVNPFKKMAIFGLFEPLVFIAQKGIFLLQNILKDIFQAYIAKKKKVGKMAIFRPKPWVNPIGKMAIFRLFHFLVFIAQKGVFSFQNIVKDIFLAYIA